MTATPESPRPRRVSLPRWVDARLLIGVGLVVVAVLVGAVVVGRAQRTSAVVSATRDLAAGTVLTGDDLTVTQVRLSDATRAAYLTDSGAAVGRQLQAPVRSGELVPAAAVAREPARTTLTVPLPTGAAPDLRAGQRIEVWASTATCRSVVLLPDVVVQDVSADSGGALSDSGTGQDVVVSVTPSLAARVVDALAIDQVELRAGVLSGGSAPVDTGALAAGTTLPDLDGCAATGNR